ncbi:MAG: DUF4836 family protein [Bacteroidetes bacterium]|nr:DUF4836 family protein [Bacteroidota bacterium]
MIISSQNFPATSRLQAFFFSLKNGLLLLAFATAATAATGQTALKYVPANADMVITVNLQNLDKKVNLQQLQQYDFYQAMLKEIYQSPELEGDTLLRTYIDRTMTDPASLGFDFNEPFYLFMEKAGFNTHTTLVMKMADKAKYESGLQWLKQAGYAENLDEREGLKIWQQGAETYAWNDEVIVNVWTQKGYDPGALSYEGEYIFDEVAEDTAYTPPLEEEITDDTVPVLEEGDDFVDFGWTEEKDTLSIEWAAKVLNCQFLQPISMNERYAQAKHKSNDVHLWVDYGFFSESMQTMQQLPGGMAGTGMPQMMAGMNGFMDVFYGDTYVSMGLNFEDGKMAIRSQLFFNEDIRRFYQRSLDVKFNKKFLRYVKGGDGMFGYFYVNYNVKNMIDEGKALMYKIFDATPQYGEMASDAMKILGIFIDEEAIGNLLKGDLLVSVSGMQQVQVTTKTYEYDADFNFTEKDTTMTKNLPIFTALASYGSGRDIQKFIDLGVHSKVLVPEGSYYKAAIPEGGEVYLAKHDGMLICTNNRYLVQQSLGKGFAKKLRLPKNHRKMLCDNASVMYWNIPNTIRAVAGNEADSNIGAMGYLNNFGKEFTSFQATTPKKVGTSVDSEMFFNLTQKDTNALRQFFNFVNDIYLEYIGGAKI